jgi:hypothetical protein
MVCEGPTLRQNAVGMPGGLVSDVIHEDVWKGIGRLYSAIDGVRVKSIFEGGRRKPGED